MSPMMTPYLCSSLLHLAGAEFDAECSGEPWKGVRAVTSGQVVEILPVHRVPLTQEIGTGYSPSSCCHAVPIHSKSDWFK